MAETNLNVVIPASTTQFVKSTLCERLEDSNEFNIQCIKNTCANYGDLNIFYKLRMLIFQWKLCGRDLIWEISDKGAKSKKIF